MPQFYRPRSPPTREKVERPLCPSTHRCPCRSCHAPILSTRSPPTREKVECPLCPHPREKVECPLCPPRERQQNAGGGRNIVAVVMRSAASHLAYPTRPHGEPCCARVLDDQHDSAQSGATETAPNRRARFPHGILSSRFPSRFRRGAVADSTAARSANGLAARIEFPQKHRCVARIDGQFRNPRGFAEKRLPTGRKE